MSNCTWKPDGESFVCRYCGHRTYTDKMRRNCKLAPPPLSAQAWSVTKALAECAQDGFKLLAKDKVKERLDICDQCEFRRGWKCGKCGCFRIVKAKLPKSNCPEGRWPELS